VTQKRFLLSGAEEKADAKLEHWSIHLGIRDFSDAKAASTWHVFNTGLLFQPQPNVLAHSAAPCLRAESSEFEVAAAPNAPLTFNNRSVGFFRVEYTTEMYGALSRAVQAGAVPPLDRLAIVKSERCFACDFS